MPLHPTLVIGPIACALALAALELWAWLRPSEALRRAALAVHITFTAAAVAAAASGNAEAARVQASGAALELLKSHDQLATGLSFFVGFALLVRLGSWRKPTRAIAAVLLACSWLAVLGVLAAGRLGGRLVFEHGVGVAAPTAASARPTPAS